MLKFEFHVTQLKNFFLPLHQSKPFLEEDKWRWRWCDLHKIINIAWISSGVCHMLKIMSTVLPKKSFAVYESEKLRLESALRFLFTVMGSIRLNHSLGLDLTHLTSRLASWDPKMVSSSLRWLRWSLKKLFRLTSEIGIKPWPKHASFCTKPMKLNDLLWFCVFCNRLIKSNTSWSGFCVWVIPIRSSYLASLLAFPRTYSTQDNRVNN